MCSSTGGPDYADTVPMARALLRAAPDRLVWGSDWPHTTEPVGSVDDAALVDLLDTWCAGDPATLQKILVANPQALYGFAAH
jgi:predicted TIM-barrel fold metal-dependent hydrolase